MPPSTAVTAGSGAWPSGDPARACLVLDFDGTLAPIVADPATSALPAATREVLRALAGRLGRVAVVSGRPAVFLADRVGVDGVQLVGLYGLEHVEGDAVVPDDRVAAHKPALDSAKAALVTAVAGWPGAELEDKGRALAVHWRRAADRTGAAEALRDAVRAVAGALQVEDGKMVVELRPPVPADKGTAVRQLAEGFDEVAFVGDDLGDLPALQHVARAGGLAVVVEHGEETDPRLRAAAGVLVEGTDGAAAWLAGVAARTAR